MLKQFVFVFVFFLFLLQQTLIQSRKVCNVVQFGAYTLANKNKKKQFKYQVVGIINPLNKSRVLWLQEKRRFFHWNRCQFLKNIYDHFSCNINDYVYPVNQEFIFRIFQINLKKTINYMLKYKIVNKKDDSSSKGTNVISLKENHFLFRFLNNINI